MLQERRCSDLRVSIHAPVKGATRPSARHQWDASSGFNSRSREGSDTHRGGVRRDRGAFQFTLP